MENLIAIYQRITLCHKRMFYIVQFFHMEGLFAERRVTCITSALASEAGVKQTAAGQRFHFSVV